MSALLCAPALATAQTVPRYGLSGVLVAGVSSHMESVGFGIEAWRRVIGARQLALRIEATGFVMQPPKFAVGCVTDPCEYRQVRGGAVFSATAEQAVLRRKTQTLTLLASGGLIAPYTKGAYLEGNRRVEHARRVALQAGAGVGFGDARWRAEFRWRVAPRIISQRVAFLTFSIARTF